MAIDKSSTPPWVKAVIIAVVVTFLASVAGIAVLGAGGGSSKQSSSASTPDATSIASQHQPVIDALSAALQADPENPDLLLQLGHAYYDYAADLTNGGLGEAAVPLWSTAISYYDRVLAVRPNDAAVLGDKAFAAYYSGSPGAREALSAFIATNDPALADQIATAQQLLADLGPASTSTTGSTAATGSAPATQ
ncbi:MAG: tetratricopeptide repeat protein [Coriobacteriales bacterium]|nr:hypothetical protein [Actinomycetes bacterium]